MPVSDNERKTLFFFFFWVSFLFVFLAWKVEATKVKRMLVHSTALVFLVCVTFSFSLTSRLFVVCLCASVISAIPLFPQRMTLPRIASSFLSTFYLLLCYNDIVTLATKERESLILTLFIFFIFPLISPWSNSMFHIWSTGHSRPILLAITFVKID